MLFTIDLRALSNTELHNYFFERHSIANMRKPLKNMRNLLCHMT